MSGGIIEEPRSIQKVQILSTRILVNVSGSAPMILHGLKDNSNCRILHGEKNGYKNMRVPVQLCPRCSMMARKASESSNREQKPNIRYCHYFPSIASTARLLLLIASIQSDQL
ncbi:unnamed protein product [Ilex paraguariensis]|uniref:Uncharacterized protein n=1 Tax=Ilex paraguariensis TaxID=185542 RepID=A0ABC8UEV4_9AQUA